MDGIKSQLNTIISQTLEEQSKSFEKKLQNFNLDLYLVEQYLQEQIEILKEKTKTEGIEAVSMNHSYESFL